jgi:hypothetical protein
VKWIFDDFNLGKISEQYVETNFSSLSGISKKLKKRLIDMISGEKQYFLLTGSDPVDHLGCCPSDEVAEANKFVRAGILESSSQENTGDTCPVTIYAFRGEIRQDGSDIKFKPDPDFRGMVLRRLNELPMDSMKQTIKWLLLAFIFISVLAGIYRIYGNLNTTNSSSFYELLAPIQPDQDMVLLFHYHKRCYQCLNMEKFTREILNENFKEEIIQNRLTFRLIDMDAPENRPLVQQFGFITAAIVLVDFEDGEEKNVKVVEDAWQLFNEESKFKSLIRQEIYKFIADDE